MKKVCLKFGSVWMDRFAEAHDFFLRKYFAHAGGPDLLEFIALLAQAACNDILEEAAQFRNESEENEK